jgi:hypothetical protein
LAAAAIFPIPLTASPGSVCRNIFSNQDQPVSPPFGSFGGGAPTTIGTNTVSFGGPSDKLKLISIEPGDEELNTVIVKWLPNPGASVTAKVWILIN